MQKKRDVSIPLWIMSLFVVAVAASGIIGYNYRNADLSPSPVLDEYKEIFPESREECRAPDLRLLALHFLTDNLCSEAIGQCDAYKRCLSDGGECSEIKNNLCEGENKCDDYINSFNELIDKYAKICDWTTEKRLSFEGCKIDGKNVCD